jgi:putative exosortase-associated protein (TIGR04073 family)
MTWWQTSTRLKKEQTMKPSIFPTMAAAAAIACLTASQVMAVGDPTPSDICSGAAAKLVRGITNVVTCPAELPKQIIRHSRTDGFTGGVIGLFAGIEMTVYRAVTGALEVVLFPVPDPGFYEPLTTPHFVWDEWDTPAPPAPL